MNTLMTKPGNSYRNNTGVYQQQYDESYDKLVPSSGEAETLEGELLRSASRLYYDYCNNGNCNAREQETHTETYTCYNCNGTGETDEEEDGICCECGGSGELEEEVDGDIFITQFYQYFIDKLVGNIPNIVGIMKDVEEVITQERDCSFSGEEMNKYDRMIDAVVEHILGHELSEELISDNMVKEVKEELKNARKKPTVKLIGKDSNVYNLLGICNRALRESGQIDKSKELTEKVTNCGSYDEALCLMMEYCEVE